MRERLQSESKLASLI